MAPILDWKKLMKVDPDALPHQEKLADRLLETMSKVLKGKTAPEGFVMHYVFFPKLSLVLHIRK